MIRDLHSEAITIDEMAETVHVQRQTVRWCHEAYLNDSEPWAVLCTTPQRGKRTDRLEGRGEVRTTCNEHFHPFQIFVPFTRYAQPSSNSAPLISRSNFYVRVIHNSPRRLPEPLEIRAEVGSAGTNIALYTVSDTSTQTD